MRSTALDVAGEGGRVDGILSVQGGAQAYKALWDVRMSASAVRSRPSGEQSVKHQV
jgi:hypothetical protein